MKPVPRILIGGALILSVLAGIWAWLVGGIQNGRMQTSVDPAEAIATIGSIMGGAMGIALAVLAFAFFRAMRAKG